MRAFQSDRDFRKFQQLVQDRDYVENGYWEDEDFGQRFYEEQFMTDVEHVLDTDYNIEEEPSTQGGGRIGIDHFYLFPRTRRRSKPEAECSIDIEEERKWMFEIIRRCKIYDDAVRTAAANLADYCEDNLEWID